MVAAVAMGFVGLVNLGGVASGSTVMKHGGSESMTATWSQDKVWICHREGGKVELKEINLNALDGHLGHGDFYPKDGVCQESSESATATETSTATATATATPTVTVTATVPGPAVTAIVPGPAVTSVVSSTTTATATATVTASPSITPAPGVVEATPAITPAPGVVEQSPTIAPLPATVPAGGGGEAPGGLPLWALLVIAAAGVTGIGASVRLAQRTTR
ncbi:MAG: hypothetical protein KGP12_01030 [Actinomycetales bacterium]|nr:hypothetical protein [Actinomycetales bacterium]